MTDVLIVGAGAAGLVCAQDLQRAGIDWQIVEASDAVGGRVRSDHVDGYTLDRGFQILLTNYPQVNLRLDLPALGLGRFEPGAAVRYRGRMHAFVDPLRRPLALPESLANPIASPLDKARGAALVADVRAHSARELLHRADQSTEERLRAAGFSERFIEAFWRPFFAGIQLDPDLEVSARRFDVILRMLALGDTGLPREGMGAVTQMLAEALDESRIRLDSRVAQLAPRSVTLASGEQLTARAIVVATDGPTARALLGGRVDDPGSRAAGCLWFAAPAAPRRGPVLMLEGEGTGPALNVVVMSEVQPSYAPEGRALIAAAVPGARALDPDLEQQVAAQLARWFDGAASDFELLRRDVIGHGQPRQTPPFDPRRTVRLGEGLYVCGDHRDTAALQGAMFSGQRTATAVLADLAGAGG